MSFNNYQSIPFWDFVRSLDGATEHPAPGPEHPAFGFQHYGPPPQGFGGPFGHRGPHAFDRAAFREACGRGGAGGWGGRGGCGARGRHCRRPEDPERSGDEKASEQPNENEKSGEQAGEQDPSAAPQGEGEGFDGPRGPWEGRRGGGRRHGHGHGRGHRGPPPFGGPEAAFNLSGLIDAFSSHPIAQALKTFAEQAAQAQNQSSATADTDPENTFTPPIDVFSTPAAYILHIALPGAKKEDVGVNWDADKSELNVAGVVYRNGDEEFLKTLTKGERKVGVFERTVKLPPGAEEKEEVDGDAISAKLEDGVLVVNVPKVEKDWTEVKKVDIE
jgi:HSP20 family protein